jgi:hypothetical protein
MRALTAALLICLPIAAQAQPIWGLQPTMPVTPRDVRFYMDRPDVLRQTLEVCHSNTAYSVLADCLNAERAASGILAQQHRQAVRATRNRLMDPSWWAANPVQREATLMQCRRRGPDDNLALPYCQVAAAGALMRLQ